MFCFELCVVDKDLLLLSMMPMIHQDCTECDRDWESAAGPFYYILLYFVQLTI